MAEQANFSELRNKISNWDLEAEEMLINKMKIFTNSYKCDFANFTGNLQNFSNNLINTQVQSYKAISNLKELSMNRFIEEKLEENPESVSEGSDSGIESGDKKIINNNEKVKIALDMSMKTINEINAQKEKNKEKIEDDAVSIASKKLSFDNSKKYGNIPFIIGTENFMKDKNIGLTDLKEEEEEEKIEIGKENEEEKEKENKNNGDWEILDDNKDDDFEEDMKDFEIDIPESEKDKKRWEKEKKKKKKEAKKKLQKSQINQNSNNLDINKKSSNDLNSEIKDQVKVPIESENDNKLENNQGNIVICEGKGASVPPPPPPPPAPVFNQVNIQKDIKKENKNESDKKQSEEISNQKENINININKKIPSNELMNPFLLAGLKNIKDDDEDDDDDGELFSKKNRKIPINNNLSQSQNPMIHMQNNLFNNINNTNNNNNLNINKKMTISKEKLNNIFGEENEEDLKIIKEEKEEDTKVKEEKSNNINNLEEPNKEKIENIFDEKNEKEENKENIEKSEVQKEENDSQQIIKDIPEQNGKNLNIKKNKLFSGLMEEEEKNNSEIIKPVESIKKQNKLNKLKKNFFEDDED